MVRTAALSRGEVYRKVCAPQRPCCSGDAQRRTEKVRRPVLRALCVSGPAKHRPSRAGSSLLMDGADLARTTPPARAPLIMDSVLLVMRKSRAGPCHRRMRPPPRWGVAASLLLTLRQRINRAVHTRCTRGRKSSGNSEHCRAVFSQVNAYFQNSRPGHPDLIFRCRSTARTRAGADAAGSGRSRSCACSRSTSRSGRG